MNFTQSDLNILILAPVGQDAVLSRKVLLEAGIGSEIMPTVKHMCERLQNFAGGLLITEEALGNSDLEILFEAFSRQESWSDLPIIMITPKKERFERTKYIIERFGDVGNISLLERPFSVITLITMTKVAVRARIKQYEIKKLIEKLEVELKSKDEFLSVASHELRTPLTSLKLQIQMKKHLSKNGNISLYQPDVMNKFLHQTDKQIDRLSRLVDDMLDISRIENGQLSLNRGPCKLNDIAANVHQYFNPILDASGSALNLENLDEVAGEWDRYRIEQIISNLISNAMKYGQSSPINIKVYKDNHFAAVDVKDGGPGISGENIDRIFHRFERIEGAKNISGLGLGLYISRQIAEMHGGTLSVESQIGQGALFKLRLPTVSTNLQNDL